MLNQLIFILGWSKKNKEMTAIFLLVLSLIVASNLLLFQFFVEESTVDNKGRHYYTYYFDETVILDDIIELLEKLEKDTDVCECLVASNPDKVLPYNDYFVASYLKKNKQDEEERNVALSYGEWNEVDNSYIADAAELPDYSFFEDFQCVGVGSTQIGNKFVDYRITLEDFKNLSFGVDAIDIILFSSDRASADTIVNSLGVKYEVEYQDDFLQSGFDSVRNALVISFFILTISLYSIMAFVEIYLYMQNKDIIAFYRSGATIKDLKRVYSWEMVVAGAVSCGAGFVFANIMCRLMKLRFESLSIPACIITFLIFFAIYLVEINIYIGSTLKHINTLHLEED